MKLQMIMNCGSIFIQWRQPMKTLCCVSPSTNINNEPLRDQLDHLHKEAEITRTKANSTRMRLMRLSETAEKLRKQASMKAAISVQSGNEYDARDLLFQKKKVTQAMEKSKNRIELLDELAAKLYEAISVKETQLIGNVASDVETDKEEPSPVRIVSINQEEAINSAKNQEIDPNLSQVIDMQMLQANDLLNGKMWDKVDKSSYEDFLDHIDQQLNNIESELVTFLKYSTLILDNKIKEKSDNSKVQQVLELLDSVHRIRERITSITETKVEIS